MGALAVILARAGSKGLAGKNLRPIAGKPCALWAVEHALRARLVTRVALSTDSLELQRLALERGVDVVARPAELADDEARVDRALRHAVETVDPQGACEVVALLYGNVPVRPEGLVDRAIAALVETGADSVQSYAPVGKHHPAWTCCVDEATGAVAPLLGGERWGGAHRRQDLPRAYLPDGGVVVVRRDALLRGASAASPHAFLGEDHRAVLTQRGEVVDIDDEIDLLLARAILERPSWRQEAHGL